MHEKCGDDLYDGKDADLEYNLLHKIIVFDQALVPPFNASWKKNHGTIPDTR